MRVQRDWIQGGLVPGLIGGLLLSCSSTAGERADASQAMIVDAEIDLCSLDDICGFHEATPVPTDASVVDAKPCPTLATYCASPHGTGAVGSSPACAPVRTWPEAVAYFCVNAPGAGRYLNCNGLNAITFGSVEFSTAFFFDSATLELVAIGGGQPYVNQLVPTDSYRCLAGSIPALDPATCASYTSGPCQ